MRIATSLYKIILVVFIFVQLLFSSVELVVLLSGFLVLLLIFDKRTKISKSVFNILSFLGCLIFLGILSSVFREYDFFDRVRDFIHFIKPIFLILSGYLLVSRIGDNNFVLKTIIYISVFFALKHLITLFFVDFQRGTIEELRLKGGANNFIELLGLAILFSFNKKNSIIKSQTLKSAFILIVSISFILYFSRTMIVGLAIILLSIYGYTKLSRKVVEYFSLGLLAFGLFYAYLFTLDLSADKPGFQNFLFKIRNSVAEVFVTPENYDPRNHREIFNHWRGYEANVALKQMKGNPMNYITGKGFGALVDLGFKAPIGGEDGLRYIPYLHNGYVYVFYKTGVFGLLLYLVLLINIYRQVFVISKSEKEEKLRNIVSGLGIYFIAGSLVITGIYNLEELSIFCLGVFFAMVYVESQNNMNLKQSND